jgi:excisionase family DNA binding protein
MNRTNGSEQIESSSRWNEPLAQQLPASPLDNGIGGPAPGLQTRESPITAKEAAVFLKIARSTVMALARSGKLPAHPITNGKRKRWLFFISELAAYVRGLGVNCGSHPCAS